MRETIETAGPTVIPPKGARHADALDGYTVCGRPIPEGSYHDDDPTPRAEEARR